MTQDFAFARLYHLPSAYCHPLVEVAHCDVPGCPAVLPLPPGADYIDTLDDADWRVGTGPTFCPTHALLHVAVEALRLARTKLDHDPATQYHLAAVAGRLEAALLEGHHG